jgi:hypothetical protein
MPPIKLARHRLFGLITDDGPGKGPRCKRKLRPNGTRLYRKDAAPRQQAVMVCSAVGSSSTGGWTATTEP